MQNNSSPELIGLLADRHPGLLVGLLGILKSGNGFVPLDPEQPGERLSFIINDCRIGLLVTEEKYRARAMELARTSSSLKQIICLDQLGAGGWGLGAGDARPANYDAPIPSPQSPIPNTEQAAYVIYTSGSTGAPKGVPITHGNLSPLLAWSREYFNFSEQTQVLQNLNYCFDFGVFELLTTLLSGGTLHFLGKDELADLPAVARYINEQGVNTIHSTPSFFNSLLPFTEGLPKLETLHLGGEALTGGMATEIFKKVGERCQLYNGYGPTEATINCAIFNAGKKTDWEKQTLTNIPIGKASANNVLYILDKQGEPVPSGVPGELHVGGDGLAYGYLGRAELTAERFIPDPFSAEPGARLYKTGDLVRALPDGNIEFLGRIDQQVKLRGYRIELGEIEAALRAASGVREAVVLAREDASGRQQLVAYLVPASAGAPTAKELRSFLQARLPAYMLPAAYVWLKALPLTPNGKLDRRALPEPEADKPEPTTAFVAPRTPQEQTLADIWRQVLRLERVGVNDNFFESGGDSLRVIQVVARASQASLRLTPSQLFQYPTIAALAEVVETSGAPPPLSEQEIVRGEVPLTPIQRLFFERQTIDPHHWNWAFLRVAPPQLNVGLLAQTLKHLLAHHDALRLRFHATEAGWRQVNAGLDEDVPLTLIDLSELPPADQSAALTAAATALQGSLNLAEGPLLRLVCFRLGAGQADRVLLIFHHLVVDLFSTRVLLEDFQTVYEQLSRGEAVRLPAKTTSFQAWAQWLAEYAQSTALRRERSYWVKALPRKAPSLPRDYPAGKNTEASTASLVTEFGAAETRMLLERLPAVAGAQMQDALLTALARAFACWTGRPRLLVEVEGHGRAETPAGIDLSRTVGWFTNIYPVLLDVRGAATASEALQLVQEQLRRIPQHGLGYGLLRYLCADEKIKKQMSALPRAEVNFNYLGQLDQEISVGGPFRQAQESKGPERSLRAPRSYVLYVVASVRGGVLRLHWNYSANLHRRSTIEGLAADFAAELRGLLQRK